MSNLPLTPIFTELGSIFAAINSNNVYRNAVSSRYNLLFSQYEAQGNSDTFDGYLTTFTNFCSQSNGFLNQLAQLARNTLVELVNAWEPQPTSTLANALNVLIEQMLIQSASVHSYSIGNSITYGANLGNSILVASTIDAYGQSLQLQIPETIMGTVTRDSNSGGATAGNEYWQLKGASSDPAGSLDYLYPMGSGANLGLTAVNANTSVNNLLKGTGSFSTWVGTSNPTGWMSSSSTYIVSGSVVYMPGFSAKFVGNAANQNLTQAISLNPSTVYQVNGWIQSTGVPTAGVMAIQLQNITGGITQTPAGVNNSVSINLHTSASGSWLSLNGTFATPTISPSGGYQIFVGTTTAITSGTSCYVDSVSMTQPSRFGSVGPYMSIFAGSSTNYNGDTVNTVITNAGSVTGDWQWAMARLGITSGSTILPSSGSPTISNTLIS